VAAAQPAQTVASFLSAVVSESEETFAQTETRVEKRAPNEPDEEDFASLVITGTGGDGDALPTSVRSRQEVWQDIENEIARRFRYTLTLFNVGNKSGRARYIPLLRRVCQRTGVRLLAKDYDVGGKCLCSGGTTYGGKLTGSYPISPLDIYDIVPLMKHSAAYNEGFHPCSYYPTVSVPPLQVSLQDARIAMESAHLHTSQRALNKGLELAQESLSLYQRVTESPSHPGVIDSMELMASIFHEADDFGMAVLHAEKALSLSIQVGGFDTSSVVNAHLTLFQMLFQLRELERAIKHLRAAIYLLDVMAGPNHTESFTAYHKLGNAYSEKDYNGRYLASALKCFEEAGKRDSFDRLMEGITSKHIARALSAMGEYKDAITAEKKAFKILSMFLGQDHKWSKECEEELQNYTKLAVEKGKGMIENEKLKEEVAKADAVAADLMAAEEEEQAKKAKKKKGKK
jgi:protein TIF31